MMAYGAAESSIRLLQKFNILAILLPIQVSFLGLILSSILDHYQILYCRLLIYLSR